MVQQRGRVRGMTSKRGRLRRAGSSLFGRLREQWSGLAVATQPATVLSRLLWEPLFEVWAFSKVVLWRCGYLGVRVGEASHPGPSCLGEATPQLEEAPPGEVPACSPTLAFAVVRPTAMDSEDEAEPMALDAPPPLVGRDESDDDMGEGDEDDSDCDSVGDAGDTAAAAQARAEVASDPLFTTLLEVGESEGEAVCEGEAVE